MMTLVVVNGSRIMCSKLELKMDDDVKVIKIVYSKSASNKT